ncbi:lipid A biosynthesis lauroyl acyltransferase [Candidatus Photodesmus katoptron]|uniref:Lipid A biosynthesis acyltransferase n=1 Tax=Candidatus Photodesmus katoptron Akat1 TaxID=1236703 RepID=S3DHP1_9GAMM|nr:LpxL/LpxP family Kdo(2)-lipid IV(A) lauroyl/palmitoleoyl acyltransferase [Candidatus Photodesmus katoptron]EPE37200.1 lipid A biosynthesis lauroyl acyltransferase [Candidatus Photodesmus katoptron Akat1]KEY90145.1 lipid A biosynthesis lauroyl acyltransferase [Candidatus Photodesmus katoptron]
MDNEKFVKPQLSIELFYFKNWLVWIGLSLLAILVNILPFYFLLKLGRCIGILSMYLERKRAKIAKRNLELSFPKMSKDEIKQLVIENFKNTGIALIETGVAWFWPTWRLKNILLTKDVKELKRLDNKKKGVLLCCVHSLNLEITARAFAILGLSGYGVYRPNKNPVYEFIQYRGRTRNGNKLIHRTNLKQMIRVLKKGNRLFYLPDQDYGHNQSVFVPFFEVKEACTTTGPSILIYATKCAIVLGSGFRNADNRYEIIADKSIEENYPKKNKINAAIYMNQYIEKIILRAPEQWMWIHKRYKSLPNKSLTNSRYQ